MAKLSFCILKVKFMQVYPVQLINGKKNYKWFITCYKYGTIIRTGITFKKVLCYMRDSAYKWFIVRKAKYFEVILNIFQFSQV